VIEREQARFDRRHPVHLEQPPPHRRQRLGRRAECLDDGDRAGRDEALERRGDAVERVCGRLLVELEHHALQRPLPGLAPSGIVCEPSCLPPGAAATEDARPPAQHGLVDRREELRRLVEVERPDRSARRERPRVRRALARQLDLARERGEPVPEARVDGRLGCPEPRHRLAAFAHVVELRAHHLREDPAAAVCRLDADDRHAR
jgi:hypothetical protein